MLQHALLFLAFACTLQLCYSFPGKILGPGIFIFQSYEHCDPPVTEIDLWITHRKFNRTTDVFDLNLKSPWSLSDEMIMEVKTATKKEGGYKPGSYYLKGPFCSTLKKLVGDLFYAIADATGSEDCPLPGTAKLADFYVDSGKLNVQILYGEYKAELNLIVEGQIKGCYLLYMNLVPKD